jgi:ATP-binding cassette subfamily C (CFTR/MRP) protein 1
MFVEIVPKSAASLHSTLVQTVMRAPLSFFVATDTGVTLNRFSQDMSLIDMALPAAAFGTIFAALTSISSACLIIAASWYIAAAMPFILVVLYGLQMFYLRTSRQLRHMDLEAKSPLYSHFLETTAGLSTIRAFGWTEKFQEHNIELLDISQKPFYLMYCIQRWLNVVLDLFVASIAVLLVSLAIELRGSTSAGAIGVGLLNVLVFNEQLTYLITSWTALETSLGAIARLRTFELETPQEIRAVCIQAPSEAWPARGLIEFKDISASHTPDSKPALENLSLKIEPGQKVAICGRTGSGKSSLLLTLFRLLELDRGQISIDKIDIASLDQEYLRSKLIIIPQDPVIFPGSIRENIVPHLSPMDTSLDTEIRDALEKVGLQQVLISSQSLDAEMAEITLSQGQKQLFCLVRALLRKDSSPILILDEASSNVDHQTDGLMQKIVAEEFQKHTVLSVVHKLDTIDELAEVVVLEAGRIVEIGQPGELRRAGGAFKRLWDSRT